MRLQVTVMLMFKYKTRHNRQNIFHIKSCRFLYKSRKGIHPILFMNHLQYTFNLLLLHLSREKRCHTQEYNTYDKNWYTFNNFRKNKHKKNNKNLPYTIHCTKKLYKIFLLQTSLLLAQEFTHAAFFTHNTQRHTHYHHY